MAKICNSCGAINTNDARNCVRCGKALGETQTYYKNTGNNKNHTIAICIVIVVVIICFAGLGGCYIYTLNNKTPRTAQEVKTAENNHNDNVENDDFAADPDDEIITLDELKDNGGVYIMDSTGTRFKKVEPAVWNLSSDARSFNDEDFNWEKEQMSISIFKGAVPTIHLDSGEKLVVAGSDMESRFDDGSYSYGYSYGYTNPDIIGYFSKYTESNLKRINGYDVSDLFSLDAATVDEKLKENANLNYLRYRCEYFTYTRFEAQEGIFLSDKKDETITIEGYDDTDFYSEQIKMNSEALSVMREMTLDNVFTKTENGYFIVNITEDESVKANVKDPEMKNTMYVFPGVVDRDEGGEQFAVRIN